MAATAGARTWFNHVAFRVRDIEQSIRWYEAAFGAREAFRAHKDDGSTQLVYIEFTPGQFIELFPNGKNPIQEPEEPLGYAHTCFAVENLEATLAHLATMNVTPRVTPRTGRAGQRLAFVEDLDGNRLELMEIPPDSPIYRQ